MVAQRPEREKETTPHVSKLTHQYNVSIHSLVYFSLIASEVFFQLHF